MTDITPQGADPAPAPAAVVYLSADQINALAQKQRENHAASMRGDPPPHVITPAELRLAIQSIRRQRGVLEHAGKTAAKADKPASGKAKVTKVNVDELDLDGL